MQNEHPKWWKTLKRNEKARVVLLALLALWMLPRFHLGFPMLTNKGWIDEHHYRVDKVVIEGFPPQTGRLTCYWIQAGSMPYWEGDFVADDVPRSRTIPQPREELAITSLCDSMNKDLLQGFVPRSLAPNVIVESNWRRFF